MYQHMQIDTILQCSSGSAGSPILHLDPIFYQQCKPLHNCQAPSGRLKKIKNQTNPSSPSIPAANRTRPQHGDQRGVIPAWRQAAAALAPVLLPLEQGGFRKPAAKSNKRKIKGLNKRKSPLLHLAWHHPHPTLRPPSHSSAAAEATTQAKSSARQRPSRWGESKQTHPPWNRITNTLKMQSNRRSTEP